MEKITIIRTGEGWKAFTDDDDTVSGVGNSPIEAIEALATAIKYLS